MMKSVRLLHHNQIFQTGFETVRLIPIVADQYVKSDRDRLQRHEKHYKMITLSEQHQTSGNQEKNGIKLRSGDLVLFQKN